jgi:hypothetical protein
LIFSAAVYVVVSIGLPPPPGCTLRKHLWDLQAQVALPVEVVGSILATYVCLPLSPHLFYVSVTLAQVRALSLLKLRAAPR